MLRDMFLIDEFKANGYNPRICLLIFLFRLANFASVYRKKYAINNLWAIPYLVFYRLLNEFVFCIELPASLAAGQRLVIHHGYGSVVNKDVILGDDVVIRHGVTIGNVGRGTKSPVIGHRVVIGAGACITGAVVIGDDAKIGPGAVVFEDVPAGAVVVVSRPRMILK